MIVRALVVEFIGTYTLIFIRAGAAVVSGDLLVVALAHGLVVLSFIYGIGQVSGTHINPAFTISMWVGNQVDGVTVVFHIIIQLTGGILGGLVLSIVLGGSDAGLGEAALADGVSPDQWLIIEIILTFLLVNAIFKTAVKGKTGNLTPVAIGLTLKVVGRQFA